MPGNVGNGARSPVARSAIIVPFGPVAIKGRPGTVNELYEVLAFVPENFKVVEAERIPCRVLNPPGFRLD